MRNSVLVASAITLALAACGAGQAESAGSNVARNFNVAAFDRIEVAGPYAVQVTTGGQPSVSARGPSEIVEKMVVEVDGSTLKIHPEKRSWLGGWHSGRPGGTAQVAVGVPMLRAAAIAGSGDMAIDRIAAPDFKGSIAGSGGLKLGQVDVQSLDLEIAGSGGVTAAGRAATARYEIAGSGDIRAAQVATDQASVEIAGAGNVQAHARSTAKVGIAGSGNVRVTGGAKCSIDKVGAGNVQCS
jgi:hypothetical protein